MVKSLWKNYDGWERFFFVLTNIGLLRFTQYNHKWSTAKFIPICGQEQIELCEFKDQHYCIKIKYSNKKVINLNDQIIAALSKAD